MASWLSGSPSSAAGQYGAANGIWKRGSKPVAAIFIHAGAGYHSVTNEKAHLEACSEAARIGMRFLKSGASAPEAVEAAIKCLEDKEITNAGYGSNLNMDGIVECDAAIVDHLGRSGACGAVPGIKNPISLAKLILDTSSQPLSLRRVPPNILVGIGARQFAEEHGMPVAINERLVSKNAKDRYVRWNMDLKKAEGRSSVPISTPKHSEGSPRSPSPGDYERAAEPAGHTQRRDHASAILTGVWNEGQPDSPHPGGSPSAEAANPIVTATPATARPPMSPKSFGYTGKPLERNPLGFVTTALQTRIATGSAKRPKVRKSFSDDSTHDFCPAGPGKTLSSTASPHDRSVSAEDDLAGIGNYQDSYGCDSTSGQPIRETVVGSCDGRKRRVGGDEADVVTDTIGAIAIDVHGNIAAGSSSGGIGMKHKGRTGPAALVGIGTAVVPEDPEDEEQASVAAVTSGTGEHMVTTLASAKCAERLFNGTRRGPGGRSVEEPDEHILLESFILDDFMGHPGVRSQPSTRAIGVMAVKKDRTGIYFYFAHNTDSFALASMSSTEREPLCVMSRLGRIRPVAQGGRKVRVKN